jgi:hypothetical protein
LVKSAEKPQSISTAMARLELMIKMVNEKVFDDVGLRRPRGDQKDQDQ